MVTAGACDTQCDPLNQNLLAGTGEHRGLRLDKSSHTDPGLLHVQVRKLVLRARGQWGRGRKPTASRRSRDSAGTPVRQRLRPWLRPVLLRDDGFDEGALHRPLRAHVVDNSGTNPASAKGGPDEDCEGRSPIRLQSQDTVSATRAAQGLGRDSEDCVFLWGFLASANGKPDALATDQFRVGVCFDFRQVHL